MTKYWLLLEGLEETLHMFQTYYLKQQISIIQKTNFHKFDSQLHKLINLNLHIP